MTTQSEDIESSAIDSATAARPRGPKPAVAYIVQVVAMLSALNHLLRGLTALISSTSLGEKTGTLIVSISIAAFSMYIFASLGKKRTFGSKRQISSYLWMMLLIYPITNMMRSGGMYAPSPHIEDDQLWGAAFAEAMRYVIFLLLIVWAGLSGGLAEFYTPKRSLVLNPGGQPTI